MLILGPEDSVPASCFGGILALGNFDGVHRGHQAIFSCAREIGDKSGVPVGVVVFVPHPHFFFRPQVPFFLLTPDEIKFERLAACGLDFVFCLRFDSKLAGLGAEMFIARVLIAQLKASHLIVGSNFRFGKNRSGDPSFLEMIAARFDVDVTIIAPVSEGEDVCSSSKIRSLLSSGRVAFASRALGYDWFVRGHVVEGARLGRALGFPTANMRLPSDVTLAYGVYAARVFRNVNGMPIRHDAVVSFGIRPTFGGEQPFLESHLFDFSGDLYNEVIQVCFVDFIRSERFFENRELLINQMGNDCLIARRILECKGESSPLFCGIAMQDS